MYLSCKNIAFDWRKRYNTDIASKVYSIRARVEKMKKKKLIKALLELGEYCKGRKCCVKCKMLVICETMKSMEPIKFERYLDIAEEN